MYCFETEKTYPHDTDELSEPGQKEVNTGWAGTNAFVGNSIMDFIVEIKFVVSELSVKY